MIKIFIYKNFHPIPKQPPLSFLSPSPPHPLTVMSSFFYRIASHFRIRPVIAHKPRVISHTIRSPFYAGSPYFDGGEVKSFWSYFPLFDRTFKKCEEPPVSLIKSVVMRKYPPYSKRIDGSYRRDGSIRDTPPIQSLDYKLWVIDASAGVFKLVVNNPSRVEKICKNV
jgi:hypothetical protein